MLVRIANQIKSIFKDRKGADMVEWVAIIAVVVGIIIIISPAARGYISSFFSSVFKNLSRMSTGG